MLAQVLRPGGGNGNADAAFRCRLTVNEATLLSGLPNRQAWARRPPGLKDFGVGPWVRADPFEEIEDEGVDSVGHDGLSHQCAASGFDARLVIVLRSTGASHCCTKKVVAALRISMPAMAGRPDGPWPHGGHNLTTVTDNYRELQLCALARRHGSNTLNCTMIRLWLGRSQGFESPRLHEPKRARRAMGGAAHRRWAAAATAPGVTSGGRSRTQPPPRQAQPQRFPRSPTGACLAVGIAGPAEALPAGR
jgi:hypothetical protein